MTVAPVCQAAPLAVWMETWMVQNTLAVSFVEKQEAGFCSFSFSLKHTYKRERKAEAKRDGDEVEE